MRYMGSKARLSKHLVPVLMENHNQDSLYVEPFCGGGNLLASVPARRKWGNDTAKYAIALLESLSKGKWKPPSVLSEDEYYSIKENPDRYDSALVGFAAYCCSYAGKEWGGYWRAKDKEGKDRNPAAEQARNLERQQPGLIGTVFTSLDYREMDIPSGSTIYCDPPYKGTTSYRGSIDYDVFWGWCKGQSSKGCNVFVSEYSAPGEFKEVWSKDVTSSLTKDTGSKRGVEKLFFLGA